jgi:hypothetical protein
MKTVIAKIIMSLFLILITALAFAATQEPTIDSNPFAFLSTTAGAIFAAVTITAFLRAHFLKTLDGLAVPALAFAIAVLITYLLPLIPSDIFNKLIQLLLGTMSGAGTINIARSLRPKIVEPKAVIVGGTGKGA